MVLRGDRSLGVADAFTGRIPMYWLFRHDEKVGHVTANCEYYRAY